jgi:hypothetical protein
MNPRIPTAIFLIGCLAVLTACPSDHHQQMKGPMADAPAPADAARNTAPVDMHPLPPMVGARGIMKAKLAHAQAVLEGIALEDFKQIKNNAHQLNSLSQQADWLVHRTIEYNVFSEEFRRITRDMADSATAKNLHAVTLDYVQMVMTCVKCHSHMRTQGLAQIDDRTLLGWANPSLNPSGH